MDNMRCVVCDKEGYGIIISGKLICVECEKKIIDCDIDSDFYEFFKNKLKEEIYHEKTV